MWKVAAVMLASSLAGCAPTQHSTRVVSSHERRVGTHWVGPTLHRVRAWVDANAVRVAVSSIRACEVTSREVRNVEDRERRSVSPGLLVPGGLLAASGAALLIDPRPSCEERGDKWCLFDEKDFDQTMGALLLVAGGALVVGGLATFKDERRQRVEAGETSSRQVPECARHPGRGLVVTLRLSDGTELSGVSDESGLASISVSDDLWARTGGVLAGALHVEGERIQDVYLVGERIVTPP